ncbi:hypothetical protein CROQUDRAFT_698735 [Cronartium quercuum f. sp. fusiforme G11]|uniref:Major facilitator superfamily (MFS) profile domain-containing protein n=1 Tax=Cronartium quercuum f. sp. fusiforme G11 TaxID=708437 RepID=A0A9P6TD77_9BASI|nr:hypothetical protein CROQUDRAFT_698735 [Cronartium quercuum f. sp. fusiforme G11]
MFTNQIEIALRDPCQRFPGISTSIYNLGVAIGPFFFSPASEVHGRVPIFRIGCTFFLIFNLACAFSRTHIQFGALRFCSGFFAGAPLGLCHVVLENLWGKKRGRALCLISLATVIGPCTGTMIGCLVLEQLSWKCLFYITSGIGFVTLLLMALCIPESKSLQITLHVLLRPFHIALEDPMAVTISVQLARISALHGFSMISGACLATKASTKCLSNLCDWLHIKDCDISDTLEYKLRCMIPGTVVLAVGSVMFAVARQYDTPCCVVDIALFLIGAAIILACRKATTYMIDKHKDQAASALVVSNSLRRMSAFLVPLIVHLTRPTKHSTTFERFLPVTLLIFILPTPWFMYRVGKKK